MEENTQVQMMEGTVSQTGIVYNRVKDERYIHLEIDVRKKLIAKLIQHKRRAKIKYIYIYIYIKMNGISEPEYTKPHV